MVWYFFLQNELDGNFGACEAMDGGHDEAISARTKLILQLVFTDKVWIELVFGRKARRMSRRPQIERLAR
jgi:hypothetical protein